MNFAVSFLSVSLWLTCLPYIRLPFGDSLSHARHLFINETLKQDKQHRSIESLQFAVKDVAFRM